MDISIIIVNYNTRKVTVECLDSIFTQTKDVDFEVIVVDNASNDDSVAVLAEYPNIRLIKSKENLGFGKANNLGFTYTIGKYILLLNSDTILLNNAIKIFFDEFEKLDKNVACIGTRLLSIDGSYNHSFGVLPSIAVTIKSILNLYLRILGIRLKGFDERTFDGLEKFEVQYVIGADLCIRRDVIEKLGLFDPDFFMYYEESEMQFRYHRSGYDMMIVSGPNIVHLECVSTQVKGKKYTYKNRKMFFCSMFLYMKKRYSYSKYLLFRFIFLFYFPVFFASYYSGKEKLGMIKMLFTSIKK